MEVKIKPVEEIQNMNLWELLKYYQDCTIAEHFNNGVYTDVLSIIEYEIRDNC